MLGQEEFQQSERNQQVKDQGKSQNFLANWPEKNYEIVILDAEGKTVFRTGLKSDETRY